VLANVDFCYQQATRIHRDYANSQSTHDNRRHQLDLHANELNELRQALSVKADALQRTEAEKDKLAAERTDVSRTVTILEADLKRVKRDAEAFGRDLKLLRSEKDRMESKQKDEMAKAERSKKQAQSQIRLLNEQLDNQKNRMKRLCDDMESHVCTK
jgi:chromosome segregation ATPase